MVGSTRDAGGAGLPAQLTSFVGRGQEVAELRAALAASRLVVLTGAGGTGKTRLALRAAEADATRWPDGLRWVALASVTDGELVGAAVAQGLGLRPPPGRSAIDAVVDHLATTQTLLLVDNCEHVVDHAAEACDTILRHCPGVTILATSRTSLGVAGERSWPVPPLSLPGVAGAQPEAQDGAAVLSDAVALFIERAREARRDFRLTEANEAAVSRVCQDLDGLPLAVELAAARVRVLSPAQIASGLDDRFQLLTGAPRGADPRHRSLRASVEWSNSLLSPDEQRLLRRLAVFVGGWSLPAAEQVCAEDGQSGGAVLDLLTSLIDQSLVLAEDTVTGRRYRMLETIRQYALEVLTDSGELSTIRRRHLDFFVDFADRTAPLLVTPDQTVALGQLDAEEANLEVALRHATEFDPPTALDLCVSLTWWWMRGHLVAGENAIAAAVTAAADEPSSSLGAAVWSRALLARHRGDYAASYAFAQQALGIAEAVGDPVTTARSLWSQGAIQLYPDPVGSRTNLRRALDIAVDTGDDWLVAHATSTLGYSHLFTDEFAVAERLFSEAMPLSERIGAESTAWYWLGLTWGPGARVEPERCFACGERAVAAAREIGDPVPEAFAHNFMGSLEVDLGRPEVALERLAASEARVLEAHAGMALPPARTALAGAHAALGDLGRAEELLAGVVEGGADGAYNLAMGLIALGDVLRVRGDRENAADQARRALEISERIGSPMLSSGGREILGRLAVEDGDWAEAEHQLYAALDERAGALLRRWLPQTLDALAELVAARGSHEEAARLVGAAHGARAELGLVRWPPAEPAARSLERALTAALGAEAFARARHQGEAVTLDEAIAWARRTRGPRGRPSHGWESLTPTEVRIVGLVAEGLTNPEIATKMLVSRATVKAHLANIFPKLGVHSRSELAARAVRNQELQRAGGGAAT